MKSIPVSVLCAALWVVCGLAISPVAFAAEDKGPTYQLQITLDQTSDGQTQTLAGPRVMFRENKPAHIQIGDDNNSYQFSVVLLRHNGQLQAKTSAMITQDGKILAQPNIVHLVGQNAIVEIGQFTIRVRVKPIE